MKTGQDLLPLVVQGNKYVPYIFIHRQRANDTCPQQPQMLAAC